MRSFRHWSFRYILDRLNLIVYERLHPDLPWLPRSMVERLAGWLRPEHRGLEWGSGRSTVWFARRVGFLLSIEHDISWYGRIMSQIKEQGISNVDYRLCQEAIDYVSIAQELPKESLDFVLVDGIARDRCAVAVLPKLKPGGILVVDNSDWYLPSESRSPSSRRAYEGAASELWDIFLREVSGWNCTWTTNGVTDSTWWEKPCEN